MFRKEFFLLSSLVIICCSASFINTRGKKDFSTIATACYEIQSREILFTGECYLERKDVSNNLDLVKKYVMDQPDSMNVATLLENGFADSTKYFQNTYPQFKNQYQSLKSFKFIMPNEFI